jgi:pyruvate dehydrogenase E2 component (dihydrolipoamide acetyltransferase)
MSVEVVMPQMGESITEGTVSKWLKAVGDKIGKDEPILEISTDKVDAEVPSPGEGVLLEIRHQEGDTVEVGTVLAVISAEGESPAAAPAAAQAATSAAGAAQPTNFEPPADTNTIEGPAKTVSAPPQPAETAPAPSGNAVEIVMPQMGESITEGTVSKWLKAVGDNIEKDEALLEISTDKVDAEVPSPAAGKLLEIRVQEGETVEVGAVLAMVGSGVAGEAPAPKSAQAEKAVEARPAEPAPAPPPPMPSVPARADGNGSSSVDDLRRTKSSPLVRRIAAEHNIDISRIPGSGVSGRVTKQDIISFIESGAAVRPQDLLRTGVTSGPQAAAPASAKAPLPQAPGDRVEKMSVMRRKIAEHMTYSKRTSAHVTTVYEVDMTNVARFRDAHKNEFDTRFGTKLTFMPFVFQAVNQGLRKFPVLNAQVDGENIIYKGDINLGMAVALDWGLIVPVIKRADTLSLSGLALAANDLADRARMKKLEPDEVQGGTFTITNPGVFGGLYGTPIINQPQVGILCVGTIEKRPKVFTSPEGDDYIAIRTMAYLALTYDHRIVDGADAERFLSFIKRYLETAEFTL